jgi:hypothetical protein
MDSDNEQKLRDDEWQNQPQDPDGLFNPMRDEEKLAEDNDTPAAPAQYPEDDRMPEDHPNTDTDIDEGGKYYGGPAEEAGYNPEPEDTDDAVGAADLDHEDK